MGGKFGDYDIDKLKHVAVPLELIHSASLVHDDVIDDADTRRGKPTVKAKWDNRIAMYTGDYIYGKALQLTTHLKQPEIHQILAKAMVEMSIGEMEQIRDFFNTEQDVRRYLLRIRRKTSLLIAVSCQLGALAADADRKVANSLYRFGYNVGMAFQIQDDLPDRAGRRSRLASPGERYETGKHYAARHFALEDSQRREPLLQELERIHALNGQCDVSDAVKLVTSSEGISRSEALADRYISKALAALDTLPDIKTKKQLRDIANFITKRSY